MKDELTIFGTNIKHILNGLNKLSAKDKSEIQRLPMVIERKKKRFAAEFRITKQIAFRLSKYSVRKRPDILTLKDVM